MLTYLILAAFLTAAHGGVLPGDNMHFMDMPREARIVGGMEADIREAPYQLALLYSRTGTGFSLYCGASIIGNRLVITGAHCVADSTTNQWRVRGGSTVSSSGGQVLSIDRVIMHERYTTTGLDWDVALLVTSSPFAIDEIFTSIISLPAQGQQLAEGSVGLLTGWGATREGGSIVQTLRKVNIAVVNQNACANSYGGGLVTANMVCLGNMVTGEPDACDGDSGGPFQINGQLIGMSSWGRGCARPGYPGVAVRVAAFRTWINANSP